MRFIKMKYEMFLIRLVDRLNRILKKHDLLCATEEFSKMESELFEKEKIIDKKDQIIDELELKIRDLRTEVFMP